MFTVNRVQAAPVLISKERLRQGTARAILINSGCANCLTGDAGLRDARTLSKDVADGLGVLEREVLVASTGIIGRRLPVPKIRRAIPKLLKHLSRTDHVSAAQGILTTDLRIKETAVQAAIGGKAVRVGGMAKGAGMIAPSMATMLSVITTDAVISPGLLRRLLQSAVAQSFNHITVDGDMSTNDTVFALASGRSGVTIRRGTAGARVFTEMLGAVSEKLSQMIVHDGEGVARVMRVEVVGAHTDREAQAAARQVANSPLVKTMLAGGDPNVGRIAAAAGSSSAQFDPDRLEITIGPQRVVSRGVALRVGKAVARELLTPAHVVVRIHLHAGRATGRMLTCDLTERYIQINARYST